MIGYKALATHPAREQLRETNDCGVLALALLCDVSYARAHQVLSDLGRKHRKGTSFPKMASAANELGYKFSNDCQPFELKTVGSLPYTMSRKGMTGRYLVWATRHWAAYIDGRLEDWSKGSRKRVLAVYKVEAA
jgi:hypothetical protein